MRNHMPEVGDVILSNASVPIKVIETIADGGQGVVYLVNYAGKTMCLKWYFASYIRELRAMNVYKNREGQFRPLKHDEKIMSGTIEKGDKIFYNLLIERIRMGSPDPRFVWPIDATPYNSNGPLASFGYIMPFIDTEVFKKFSFYARPERFCKFTTGRHKITGMLSMARALEKLHGRGYCYIDINPQNVFLDENGNVKILDTDNIMPNNCSLNLYGINNYQAPEVILGTPPNIQSDYFSYALFLFFIMFGGQNPYLGSKSLGAKERDLVESLAKDPIYIFDPTDRSNVLPADKFAHTQWPVLPDYLKDAFLRSFGKNSVKNPMNRLSDSDWRVLLERLRGDHYRCDCKASLYLKEDGLTSSVCSECGRSFVAKHGIFCYRSLRIPMKVNGAVYMSALDSRFEVNDEFLRLAVQIEAGKTIPYIKNMSRFDWNVTYVNGRTITAKPNQVIKYDFNMKIEAGPWKINIVKN